MTALPFGAGIVVGRLSCVAPSLRLAPPLGQIHLLQHPSTGLPFIQEAVL